MIYHDRKQAYAAYGEHVICISVLGNFTSDGAWAGGPVLVERWTADGAMCLEKRTCTSEEVLSALAESGRLWDLPADYEGWEGGEWPVLATRHGKHGTLDGNYATLAPDTH